MLIGMWFPVIHLWIYVSTLSVSLMILFHLVVCLGSPVLGYLTAGILIGPYGLSIIRNVHATKAIAEFEVVFLLFNIGLEVGIDKSKLRFSLCITFKSEKS